VEQLLGGRHRLDVEVGAQPPHAQVMPALDLAQIAVVAVHVDQRLVRLLLVRVELQGTPAPVDGLQVVVLRYGAIAQPVQRAQGHRLRPLALLVNPVRGLAGQEVPAVQVDRPPVLLHRGLTVAAQVGRPGGIVVRLELLQVDPHIVRLQPVAIAVVQDARRRLATVAGHCQNLPQRVHRDLQGAGVRPPLGAGPEHLVQLLAQHQPATVDQQVLEEAARLAGPPPFNGYSAHAQ
jgi:hypothetical protein